MVSFAVEVYQLLVVMFVFIPVDTGVEAGTVLMVDLTCIADKR